MEFNLEHTELSEMLDVSSKPVRILVLNKNYLRFLFSEFLPPTLEHLSLDENDIHHLELSHPLPHLKTLTLDKNNLKYMDVNTRLSSLHTFSANCNSIWNTEFLSEMPSLKHLNLSKNDLKTLNNLPSSLQTLTAKFNRIQMVQSRLPESLVELNLLGNSLRIGSLPIRWSSNLRFLNLAYNSLKEFPKRLPDTLEDLRLMNNEIELIPSKLPSNLKNLNISGNKIRELPLKTNIRVEVLFASHNRLTQDFKKDPLTWVSHFWEERNWNQNEHHSSQRVILRCWKQYLLKIRLRHIARSRRIYEELLMIALHPDHILQTDVFSPGWSFRKPQTECHNHKHPEPGNYKDCQSHSNNPCRDSDK